jgi:diketogulonate reductase-like aldo/keto reductase
MDPLSSSEIIEYVARKHGKSKGQIIMRWHIDTGSVPVFMTQKRHRLAEYSQIFDFNLDQEEIERISSLNLNYKIFLESVGCPGF